MDPVIERFAYTPTDTQGRFLLPSFSRFTIERPWRPWDTPGGQPFESCVPDGDYELVPYERGNGLKTFALVNESLGVYFRDMDRPKQKGKRKGRYKCLIHPANYAYQVVGCIGPGSDVTISPDHNCVMVTKSRQATAEIMDKLAWKRGHTLTIRPALGTADVKPKPARARGSGGGADK